MNNFAANNQGPVNQSNTQGGFSLKTQNLPQIENDLLLRYAEKHYGFLRFIVGLAAGTLTLFSALNSAQGVCDVYPWAARTAWCSSALAILFGVVGIYGEERAAHDFWAKVSVMREHGWFPKDLSYVETPWFCRISVSVCYFFFGVSILSIVVAQVSKSFAI
jgi:hypothetical protein